MRGRRPIAITAALVALACACRRPERDERLLLRLDADAFAPQGANGEVKIGDEVRRVPFARDVSIAAEAHGATVRNGRLRATLRLARESAGLPKDAFTASAQEVAAVDVETPGSEAIGHVTLFTTLPPGWRLYERPNAPRQRKLVAPIVPILANSTFNVRLTTTTPMSRALVSRPFALPAGARVELTYGIARPSGSITPGRTTFTATLACAWRPRRVLLRRVVDASDPAASRWLHAAATAWVPARDCRLHLDVAREAADAAGDPVWGIPRVTAPAPRPPPAATVRPNLVLISLDTVRADHLSGYGYPRMTTPGIDRLLMSRGTTFGDVSTTFPMTDIAHWSLFTSRYPESLPADGVVAPTTPVTTLAETLRAARYQTRAFTEDGLVGSTYGFARGFGALTEHEPVPGHRGHRVFREGVRWLRGVRRRRFFLFLHTYKAHTPYDPAPEYAAPFAGAAIPPGIDGTIPSPYRAARDDYDGGLRELDDMVAHFLDKLDRLGLGPRTIVALVSDHGEAFGEHGVVGHGLSAHQEALHVPFVLRGPGIPEGWRIDVPVSLVDVAPTLLDLLGLEAMPEHAGRSLRPALDGATMASRPIFFGWNLPDAHGVRDGDVKVLMTEAGVATFGLRADPHEERPVRSVPAWAGDALEHHLASAAADRAALASAQVSPPARQVSPDTTRALRTLGYVE